MSGGFMLFLIAYDIADPKRLRRVARAMEKWGTRCQKSVFILRGSIVRLEKAMQAVTPLIAHDEDIVQAWRLSSEEDAQGWTLGTTRQTCPAGIVVAGKDLFSIGQHKNGRAL
jgi:CRISPR-associated protein Cas2